MKKLFLLLALLLAVLTFASCESSESGEADEKDKVNTEAKVKVGDILDKPEKSVSIEDVEKLTVKVDVYFDGALLQNSTRALYRDGDVAIYYTKSAFDGYVMEELIRVSGKETVSYRGFNGELNKIDGNMAEGMSDEEYCLSNFAWLGLSPENEKSITGYLKCEDEKVGDKDCYVYDLQSNDEYYEKTRIYVDKESGLWIKYTSTVEGAEMQVELFDVEESVTAIPGTLPVAIESTDIYNTNLFRLTAKSLDVSDPNFAGKLIFEAVNKSESGNGIRIYTNSFDVNGLTLAQKVFDQTVSAGETVEFEVEIPNSSAELAGIEMIKEITMSLHLETADGFLIENIDAEKINTDAPADLRQEIDKTGTEILNENGIRVVFQSFDFKDGTPMFKAWVENKTYPYPVRITVNLNKINGEEYDDFEKLYMPAYSEGYSAFYLSDSDITELNSIEITCEAFSGALFNSDRVTEETEPITIELK